MLSEKIMLSKVIAMCVCTCIYVYACDGVGIWGREMMGFGSANKADKAHALGWCFLF